MRFREAGNSDGPAARELVFTILREYGFHPDPAGIDADLTDIEGSYGSRGGSFQLMEDDDGRLIGTLGLYPLREGVCELRKMYLKRELRGRGQGKRLVERAIEQARALGFRRIELETESRLETAIHLYRRYGFLPIQGPRACGRCDHAFALDLDPGAAPSSRSRAARDHA